LPRIAGANSVHPTGTLQAGTPQEILDEEANP
jgi:hypothetical protein